MLFEIQNFELSGDLSAINLFLVKYYNSDAPENSLHEFYVANDYKHLETLVKNRLEEKYNDGNWSSVEEDDNEFENFDEHFENDWYNWIKYFEVGKSSK